MRTIITTYVMGSLSDFAAKHWVIGGLATSLLWFAVGRQDLRKRQMAAAGWQSIGVIIALIVCGWSLALREWFGLLAGIAVAAFEVYSMRRTAKLLR
jgi:arginine exporter protein ArgO